MSTDAGAERSHADGERPASRDVDVALSRSALFEAAALGFGPPSAAMVARLASRRGAEGLLAAAVCLDRETLAPLVDALADTDTSTAWLVHAHRRLFGHTVRGEVPAYETEYGGDDLFRQPHELADITGFYAAFGLTLAAGGGERADHVRCECEFLAFLTRREAVALEQHDPEAVAEIRKATRLFLRDHLGRFMPALAERLREADDGGFYAALGAFADALVHQECARAGVELGPIGLGLRTAVEDRVPMACGSCPLAAADGVSDGD